MRADLGRGVHGLRDLLVLEALLPAVSRRIFKQAQQSTHTTFKDALLPAVSCGGGLSKDEAHCSNFRIFAKAGVEGVEVSRRGRPVDDLRTQCKRLGLAKTLQTTCSTYSVSKMSEHSVFQVLMTLLALAHSFLNTHPPLRD